MVLNNRIGIRVKKLRSEKGWSQEKLAIRAGVSRSCISLIEEGRRRGNPAILEKLAGAFGIDPGLLLTNNEDDYSEYIFKLKSLPENARKELGGYLDFLLIREARKTKGDTEFGEEYSLIFQKIHSTPRNDKRVA